MQINNNVQSPNFGMALKITKGGVDYLKKNPKYLEKLGQIGEEMKDYKHWDLFVTESGFAAKPKEFLKNGYYDFVSANPAKLSITPQTNSITLKSRYSDFANKNQEAAIRFDDLKPGQAQAIVNKFENMKYNMLEQFSELVRMLENKSAAEAAKKAAAEASANKITNTVNDLVSKFGVDA